MIYGYSWYLNTVCKDWSALIENDYESVMPLPLSRRFGLQGIETPCFVSQLGIFSSKLVSNEKVKQFLKAIPSKMVFIDLCLNKFNKSTWRGVNVFKKSHFELDLIKPYQKIVRSYDKELREKLVKAREYKLTVLKGISPNELFELNINLRKSNHHYIGEGQSRLLRSLISTSFRYNFGELYGVYDAFNTLCCVAFFVWSESRAILLYVVTTPEGIQEYAFHFLVDHFIQVNSSRFITLNFDYSEPKGSKDVYKEFGAIESDYQNIIKNRIPFISKMLKKRIVV